MKTVTSFVLTTLLGLAACGGSETAAGGGSSRPRLAFVTNCAVPFWAIGEAGARKAGADHGANVSVHMPANGTIEEQTRIVEDLLATGVQGIALSPIDPASMTGLLERVTRRTILVTHDSDAPESDRLCYIGMVNYDAGRMCGRMIERALPDGGVVVIVVGTLDQDNARGRRQGLIDELLDRDRDPTRLDPQDATLKHDKWEIRATYTDQFDAGKTKQLAEDVLTRWSDLDCLVGLFAYEPPQLMAAVEAAGRLDDIVVAAFDEDEGTLQGIVDGKICGTIVQNPYDYGYRSIELLSKLVGATDAERAALIPQGRFIDIPARTITKTEVAAFWADLKQKMAGK